MRTLYDLKGASPGSFRRPVTTVGNFDGVHRGHQAVLALLAEQARATGGEAAAVTFERHPREVLLGERPRLVTSLPHRLHLLAGQGVDVCIVLRFNRALSEMEPEAFLDWLQDRMGLAGIVAGPDSAFGKDGRGDRAFLVEEGRRRGLAVSVARAVLHHGEPVSSTRLRAAILDGDLGEARALLGRPFSLFGTVVRGHGRGRKLGFPTANLDTGGETAPPAGVYATRALTGGRSLPSVTSVGSRPTFATSGSLTVETHLLDFEGDLYGADMEVVFEARLRDETAHAGPEELSRAIARDADRARTLLGQAARTAAP